jgi:hypothetical protein
MPHYALAIHSLTHICSTARTLGGRHDVQLAGPKVEGARRPHSTARTLGGRHDAQLAGPKVEGARRPHSTARTLSGRHDAQLARPEVKGARRPPSTARTRGGRHDAQLAGSTIEGARRPKFDGSHTRWAPRRTARWINDRGRAPSQIHLKRGKVPVKRGRIREVNRKWTCGGGARILTQHAATVSRVQ